MLRSFEIHPASTVEEATELLARFGEAAAPYAGGTELLLVMKRGLLHYRHLVDVKTIASLRRLEVDRERRVLRVGAAVTHRQLEHSELVQRYVPVVSQVERRVANVRVRSMGTLGGNLCFADPHSDLATLLQALGASVHLQGAGGRRRWVPIEGFALDSYTTAREPDELLVEVEIALVGPRERVGYEKFQFHERPSVGVAVRLTLDESLTRIDGATVVAGCVTPIPRRLEECERALRGAPLHGIDEALREAAVAASRGVDPVDDLEGSAEYKRHLTGVMLGRAVRQALAGACPGGVSGGSSG